jgi:hypothetical protein
MDKPRRTVEGLSGTQCVSVACGFAGQGTRARAVSVAWADGAPPIVPAAANATMQIVRRLFDEKDIVKVDLDVSSVGESRTISC